MSGLRRSAAPFLLVLMVLAGRASAADAIDPRMPLDDDTQLLLRINPAGTALECAAGGSVKVTGGTIVADPAFGHVVRLAETGETFLSVQDGGRFQFAKGFTFEAWLNLKDAQRSAPGVIAEKEGTFSLRLGKQLTLDVGNMIFPRAAVVTTDKNQIPYFPVENEGFGGATALPIEWVHVAVTYDPDRAVIRTWIDGSEDRVRYLTRQETGTTLEVNPASALQLFKGLNNALVGPVRISKVARPIGPSNPLEVYVHQLPYQNRIVLEFAHLGSNLSYPLQTSVTWENPNGPSTTIYRGTLTGPENKLVQLEPKGWNNDYYNVHVRVTAQHKQLFSRMVRVANARVTQDKRIVVRPDKRIQVNGKTIFPLVMYHVQAEDIPQVAEIGFQYIVPRAPNSPFLNFGRKSEAEFANIKTALDTAEKAGVQLIVPARISYLDPVFRFKNHPGLGAWASYDEPWGVKLDKMLDTFNAIKMLSPEVPIMSPQNNLTRMSETGEGLDILACDPYCIPLVSLRMVPDATRACRKAVADLKPVWTFIDQYHSSGDDKRPSLEELRCMLYLSIAAGADGFGMYAWDYRRRDGQDLWCTKNSPKDLEILRTAIQELVGIQHVLIVPNDDSQVSFSQKNPAIHVALKRSGKQTWLVLANDSRGPEQATVVLNGVGDATATNLANSSKLSIVGGKLKLDLAPLESGVYRVE